MLSEKIRPPEPAPADPIPEVLHAMCQPLTSLRCALETTLLQPRDSEQYRISLRESLGLAEQISELTAGLRELLEAEKQEPSIGTVALHELLHEVVGDLLLSARRGKSRIALTCESPLQVKGDRQELKKAFLYLMSFALEPGANAKVRVHAWKTQRHCQIAIWIPAAKERNIPWSAKDTRSKQAARNYLHFLIARSIFEKMGGGLRVAQEAGQVSLRGHLAVRPEVHLRKKRGASQRRRG